MKKLVFFAVALASGFALGSRRARKRGPIEQLCIEIKADTSQAVAALGELTKKVQVCKVHVDGLLKGSGKELTAVLRAHDYRQHRTGGEGACMAEVQPEQNEGFPRPPAQPLDEALTLVTPTA